MRHLIVYVGLDGRTYVKWISHRDWERLSPNLTSTQGKE